MLKESLIESLFKYGIGEYYFLHIKGEKTMLGNIVYEKGKIHLKDDGLLSNMKPNTMKLCWENGMIGMVCGSKNKTWESLTFYGIDNCEFPEDTESTRHGFMMAAQNQYGENLLNFSGSIYRGFDLMLNNHFLPVILLNKIKSKQGEIGLAVIDLRSAPMSISLAQEIHNVIRQQTDNRLSLTVEDNIINNSEFENLFKDYLSQNNPDTDSELRQ